MAGDKNARYLWLSQVLILLFLLIFIFPIPKVLIEEWSVRVIDQDGVPVSGIRVSGGRNNYTFGLAGGADFYTDADGKAIFPKHVVTEPVIYWTTRAAWNVLNLGVHASFGTIGAVRVSDQNLNWEFGQSPERHSGATCADSECTSAKLHSQFRIVLRKQR